jgi:hypothetical protein
MKDVPLLPIAIAALLTAGAFAYIRYLDRVDQRNLKNDPFVQQIKNEVILPFCQTDGELTSQDLPKHFTQHYIDFYQEQADKGVDDPENGELLTPVYGATRFYRFMFEEFQEFKDCESYLEKIKTTEVGPYEPRLPADEGFADYIYEYKPSDEATIRLYLVENDGGLILEDVARRAYPKIDPNQSK